MPESLEMLDLLLLTVPTPRKVHRDGIQCHGLRYLSLTLAAYVGEQVTVRYDRLDLAEVRVFHQGQFTEKGIKITDREMRQLETQHLTRHDFHGDWNYCVRPANPP